MLLFIICEAPQKISTIFKPFLAIFTLFHLKNWPYLQKPEFGNLAKTRFWFLLVNNSLCIVAYHCHGPGHILKKLQGIGVHLVHHTAAVNNSPAFYNVAAYLLGGCCFANTGTNLIGQHTKCVHFALKTIVVCVECRY